jgi:hypothetical protein
MQLNAEAWTGQRFGDFCSSDSFFTLVGQYWLGRGTTRQNQRAPPRF